jgi:hypothetical protein
MSLPRKVEATVSVGFERQRWQARTVERSIAPRQPVHTAGRTDLCNTATRAAGHQGTSQIDLINLLCVNDIRVTVAWTAKTASTSIQRDCGKERSCGRTKR